MVDANSVNMQATIQHILLTRLKHMSNKQHTASHRCQQLLQHNKDNLPVFIRYGWRYDFCWSLKSEKQGWHLYRIETADDTWREYPHYIATIKYCPFCGEELILQNH